MLEKKVALKALLPRTRRNAMFKTRDKWKRRWLGNGALIGRGTDLEKRRGGQRWLEERQTGAKIQAHENKRKRGANKNEGSARPKNGQKTANRPRKGKMD